MMAEAKSMWTRAVTIVNFETERKVALAVIKGHLSHYLGLPDEILTRAAADGIIQAQRLESEIEKVNANASRGIVEKAILARELLVEAGIVKESTGA